MSPEKTTFFVTPPSVSQTSMRAQVGDGGLGVVQIIQRRHARAAGASGLAGEPFRVGLLDVGAVAQHDLAEVAGGVRGDHRAVVAVFVQQRDAPGVVDVGVGQQHEAELRFRDGQRRVLIDVLPLLQAAVHETVLPADLDEGAASRDLVGRA